MQEYIAKERLATYPGTVGGTGCKGTRFCLVGSEGKGINTLRRGDADLRFYITTVQDG